MRPLAAFIVLASACGPALPEGADHPASPDAADVAVPALATALTGDPAPPPEDVGAEARTFALDGDPGVRPPVLGIARQEPGTPRPSRAQGVEEGGHAGHGATPTEAGAHQHEDAPREDRARRESARDEDAPSEHEHDAPQRDEGDDHAHH